MSNVVKIKKKNDLGMRAKENVYQAILWVFLLAIAASMILPFVYVVVLSFTDSSVYVAGEFSLWPKKWSMAAYELIVTGTGSEFAEIYFDHYSSGYTPECIFKCRCGIHALKTHSREKIYQYLCHVYNAFCSRYGTEFHEYEVPGAD